MTRLTKIILYTLGTLLLATGFSFSPPAAGRINISIRHLVGKALLKLDSVNYTNSLGQSFRITKFKYYLGGFTLKQDNGAACNFSEYFLVSEEEPASKQILLDAVPGGHYTTLEFTIGVDSLHNCSGAQSGALDPVNAMFWAWNTGYIFLKLEGNTTASRLPGHLFEYHIGGYRTPNNCIRRVSLKIDLPVSSRSQSLALNADVMKVLEHSFIADFGKTPAITGFQNATVMADNYQHMFSTGIHED